MPRERKLYERCPICPAHGKHGKKGEPCPACRGAGFLEVGLTLAQVDRALKIAGDSRHPPQKDQAA